MKEFFDLDCTIATRQWCDKDTKGPCACADQHNADPTWGHWRGGRVLTLRDLIERYMAEQREAIAQAAAQYGWDEREVRSIRLVPLVTLKPEL